MTLLTLCVAFGLFGTMITLNAAYERWALITSLLGGLFPAVRAGRLPPSEALRVQ